MTTKHSKDYYRVVNGKLVHTSGHTYNVDREFDNLFGGSQEAPEAAPATTAPATTAPAKIEPAPHAPAAAPEYDLSGVDREFDKMFGEAPKTESVGPLEGQKVPFDQLKPGMVFKYPSGNTLKAISTNGDGVHLLKTYAADGTTSLKDFGSKLWNDQKSLLYAGMERPGSPEEPATEAPAAPLTPTSDSASDILTKLQNMSYWGSADIGNIHVSKSSGGFFMVNKTGNDGVPLNAAAKKVLAELHPPGYKKKQQAFLVKGGDDAKLAMVLDQISKGPLPKAPKFKIPEVGSHPPFSQVKEGMQFGYNGKVYTMLPNTPDGWLTMEEPGGHTLSTTPKSWNGKAWKNALKFTGMATGPDGLKVGDTKVENGKTYILNANHHWELVEEKKPAAPKVATPSLPKNFPFKQIGPQGGSNPGGLYEDAFGKKWYIKFPADEDQAKSEMLAAKLYDLMGVGAPKTKMVMKDGKLGIASAYQEGLSKVTDGSLLAKQDGVKEGFGADAWLANWDVVGLGFDNLLVGNDGKAKRIDPGGALDYRAQGGLKGDAFGNAVSEIHTLRDASKNPQAASVFGTMTQDEISKSMIPVLELPDDIIQKAVQMFGPGDDNKKNALAAKLIARKHYLAKQFPEAEAIVHPPKPDPKHLPVDKAQIPQPPNFMDWNGQGKGLSGNEKVNQANQAAAEEVHQAAMRGDLVDLENLQVHEIDKNTGESKLIPIKEHPSTHVKQYWSGLVGYLNVVANPGSEKLKTYSLATAEDVSGLSEAFPSKPFGKNTENIDSSEVLGYFMTLGSVGNPQDFTPKNAGRNVTSADTAKAHDLYLTMPQNLKNYISQVQGDGAVNHHFKGNDETYYNVNIKDAVKQAYAHAVTKPEGTRLWRWMDIPSTMKKQLEQAEPGLVFQNTDSMCCSKKPEWNEHTHFGHDLLLKIHYADGAKAVDTFGSGHLVGSEGEITTLPGQRFMILNKGKAYNGVMELELLMLPPDPTFIESVDQHKKGKAA
jgi:hypothetical protein